MHQLLHRLALLISAALFLLPLCVLAADVPPASGSAPSGGVRTLHAVIPFAVPVLLALLKLLVPHIPKVALPILAPLLGGLIDFAASGLLGTGTVLGLIAGAAGVGIREIQDQILKRITNEI